MHDIADFRFPFADAVSPEGLVDFCHNQGADGVIAEYRVGGIEKELCIFGTAVGDYERYKGGRPRYVLAIRVFAVSVPVLADD